MQKKIKADLLTFAALSKNSGMWDANAALAVEAIGECQTNASDAGHTLATSPGAFLLLFCNGKFGRSDREATDVFVFIFTFL